MPVTFLSFCISGFSAKPDAISPFCKDRSAFPFPRCCQKHGIFFICPFIEIAAHIRIKPWNSVTFLLCHQHQQKKTAKHHAQNPKAAAQKQDSIFPEPEYFGELFVWYGKGAKSRQSRHRHRDRTDQIGTDRRLSDDQAAYDADRIARRSRHAKPGFPQKFKGQFHQKDFRCRRKRHAASCLRHGADQIARQKLRVKRCRRHIKPRKSKCQKSRHVTDQPQKSDDPFITVVIVRRLKQAV